MVIGASRGEAGCERNYYRDTIRDIIAFLG